MRTMKRLLALIVAGLPFVCIGSAKAQIPRINTFFPIGGRVGTTVDVEVRGANLEGANLLLVHGTGLSGTVQPGDAKVDETHKPVWQAKCGGCHELRSPANRSLTPAQWAATVDRMVKVRQAPLSTDEQAKVSAYLQSAARAGRVTAQVKVAPDVLPGLYELRVGTPRGVSTAAFFEVGALPEVIGSSSTRELAQPVTLPCIANGCFASNGEHHYFKFKATKGQRLVFNLKGYRYNDANQMYFNPDLRLYDGSGRELVENHGYYDFDPLIDWNCPAEGDYTLEVRDLLGSSNPGSVYRLTMGALAYNTVVYPPGGQAGKSMALQVAGTNLEGQPSAYSLTLPSEPGLTQIASPQGPQLFWVTPYPTVINSGASTLPAGFGGRIGKPGDTQTFTVQGSGAFEFEIYGSRVGSPGLFRASLLNAQNQELAHTDGENRFGASLSAGQSYTLRVQELTGKGGPEVVYFVEARPGGPELACVARGDNVTLRPGISTLVDVILTRRDNIDGDVQISAENLPPGVTATPVAMPPDRNEGWLMVTAASSAQPTEKPIHIVASGHNAQGQTKVHAIPEELYLLNNQQRTRDWSETVVAVRGASDFTVESTLQGPIKVHPRKAFPVPFHIKRRKGFTAAVTVFLTGLPQGWTADPQNTGGDTVTLTVRPDGNDPNPYLKRDPKWTPLQAYIEAQSDEFRFAFGMIPVSKADRITDDDR